LGLRHIKYEMPGNVGGKGRVAYLPSDILAFREQFMVGGESKADGVAVEANVKV
jgi:hypothetical protein